MIKPDKAGHKDAVDVATRHTTSILMLLQQNGGSGSNDSGNSGKGGFVFKCRNAKGKLVPCF